MTGLLKTIGFIVLFYFVTRILRSFFDPMFMKNVNAPSTPKKRNETKETEREGEFIDYEEVN